MAITEKEFLAVADVVEEEMPVQEMFLNMGPSHPSMHGVVRIMVRLSGERVIWSDVEIGYLHRAFEKSCEKQSWNTAIIYTDRLNYVSPIINNVGYCMAVEKLLEVTVPERGEYARVLVSEAARVSDHLTSIGAAVMELGAFTVFLYTMKAREWLYEIFEAACGARVTTNFTRIGGLCAPLPEGFEDLCRAAIPRVRGVVDEVDKLITRNRIFIDRVQGIGAVTAEEAVRMSFTGPCLRAAGVPYDIRRSHPYSIYDRLDFTVPVGTRGDVLDRYLVRMEEMRQSVRIVRQCLDRLPDGPVMAKVPKVIKPPKGEAYFSVEGPKGELGYYVVSDGTDKPYRLHVRPACFINLQALPELVRGHLVADLIAVIGTLDIVLGEIDR